MEKKTCSRCKIEQPIHEFRFDNRAKNLRKPACRVCENARMRADRKKHGEKRRAADRDHYRRTEAKHAVTKLIRRYGLSEDEATEVAKATTCELCGKEQTGGRRLVLDHCHATGKHRGMLCDNCNTALGKFKDDAALIRKAADYIDRGGSGRF